MDKTWRRQCLTLFARTPGAPVAVTIAPITALFSFITLIADLSEFWDSNPMAIFDPRRCSLTPTISQGPVDLLTLHTTSVTLHRSETRLPMMRTSDRDRRHHVVGNVIVATERQRQMSRSNERKPGAHLIFWCAFKRELSVRLGPYKS